MGTPSWAGPLTTSLRGLWVSGYLLRAMADREQGRPPENRPSGDDSDPRAGIPKRLRPKLPTNVLLSNQRELQHKKRSGGPKTPLCKGKGPENPGVVAPFAVAGCRGNLRRGGPMRYDVAASYYLSDTIRVDVTLLGPIVGIFILTYSLSFPPRLFLCSLSFTLSSAVVLQFQIASFDTPFRKGKCCPIFVLGVPDLAAEPVDKRLVTEDQRSLAFVSHLAPRGSSVIAPGGESVVHKLVDAMSSFLRGPRLTPHKKIHAEPSSNGSCGGLPPVRSLPGRWKNPRQQLMSGSARKTLISISSIPLSGSALHFGTERSSNGSSRSHLCPRASSPSFSTLVSPLQHLGLRPSVFYLFLRRYGRSHRVRLWQGGPASTYCRFRLLVLHFTGTSIPRVRLLGHPEVRKRPWPLRRSRRDGNGGRFVRSPSFVVRSAPVVRSSPDAFPFWSLYNDGPLSSRPQPLGRGGDVAPCEDTREVLGLSL